MDELTYSDIAIELEYLDKTVKDIGGLLDITNNRENNVYDSAASAMLISQFYNGIENILKRIIKISNINLPIGGNSHIEMFLRFTEKNNTTDLPILFTNNIIDGFTIIRRFRHFARHGYAYHIEWEKLKEGMLTVPGLYNIFKNNLENYIKKR